MVRGFWLRLWAPCGRRAACGSKTCAAKSGEACGNGGLWSGWVWAAWVAWVAWVPTRVDEAAQHLGCSWPSGTGYTQSSQVHLIFLSSSSRRPHPHYTMESYNKSQAPEDDTSARTSLPLVHHDPCSLADAFLSSFLMIVVSEIGTLSSSPHLSVVPRATTARRAVSTQHVHRTQYTYTCARGTHGNSMLTPRQVTRRSSSRPSWQRDTHGPPCSPARSQAWSSCPS